MHEGRAAGAEPNTSSWQGGKLLEMTAAGREGVEEGVLAGLFHADSLQRPLCAGGTGTELLRKP